MVVGILLGPAFAGGAFPDIHDALYSASALQALGGVAAWAVAVFVWLAGIKLDLRQAWANRRECIVTAGFALAVPLVAGAILLATVLGKLAGIGLAGHILGWKSGEAAVIGWILQTKGAIMIAFTTMLLDSGVISRETFTALLLMGLASTILTFPIVVPRLRRVLSGERARA